MKSLAAVLTFAMFAVSARAEIRSADMKVFGMD